VHPASSRAQLAHLPVEHGNLSLRWDKAPARTGFSLRCLHQSLPGHAVAFDMIDGCLFVVSGLATNAVTAAP